MFNRLQVPQQITTDTRRTSSRTQNVVNSSFCSGLYCSGWLKTGPTGVIATTMNNSFDTARSLVEDLESGALNTSAAKPGSQSVRALLEKRGTLLPPSGFFYYQFHFCRKESTCDTTRSNLLYQSIC